MGQTLRDRREAYSRVDLETNFRTFGKELGNAATAKFAANSICYGTNTVEGVKKTMLSEEVKADLKEFYQWHKK